MLEQRFVVLTVFALCALAQIAQAQSICRITFVGSGNAPSGTAVAASAIRTASVACQGKALAVTGPPALRTFAADWTGVTFTASAQASALLTIRTSQVVIQQSTFRDLNLAAGSVVSVAGGSLNLTGSTFSGNTVRGTSSVLTVNETDVSIQASTFQGNSAEGFGGALSGSQGTLSVTDTRFIENQSGVAGGGISYLGPQASRATFTNVTIDSNVAVCRGGGGYFSFVDDVEFTDSVITNNSVTEFAGSPTAGGVCLTQYRFSATAGGGIFADQYTTALFNKTLIDANFGNGDGGGMFVFTGVNTRIVNSNITNNAQTNGAVAGMLAPAQNNVIIEDSLFANNTGPSVGGFLCQGCAGVNITRTIFDQNQAFETERDRGTGGGVCLVSSCSRLCYLSENQFTNNQAITGDGGGLFAQVPVNLTVVGNLFEGNEAANAGGLVVTGSGETLRANEFIVRDNVFRGNKASGASGIGGGMGFSDLRSVQISDCTFDDNSATTYGGGVYVSGLSNTVSSITDCTFTNNSVPEGGGGGAYLFQTARSTVTDSVFTNNTADAGAGTFTVRVGRLTFSNLTYTANTGVNNGGAHHSETTNTCEIIDSTFRRNGVSKGLGGGVFVSGADETLISNTLFEDNFAKSVNGAGGDGGALWSDQGQNVTVQASTFMSNTAARNGGGFFAIGPTRVSVLGSNFTNCSAAVSGGGAYLTGTGVQLFSGSAFTENKSPAGGGLTVRNVTDQLTIVDGTLDANVASTTGGGLFLTEIAAASTLNITTATITNNEANDQGGGVSFVSSPGATLRITKTSISDNKADAGGGLYGDDDVIFDTSGLQQNGNSASTSGTADLGCGNCRTRTDSGSISSVSNAPASVESQTADGTSATAGGGGNSLSGGAIAGIVIGVLVGVALLALAAFLILRRRKAKRADVEVGKKSAVSRRPPVKSAFSEEGTGSFWSQARSTPNGSIHEQSGGALDGFSSQEFDTDKTAKTAPSYTSSAPLINLHSGMSNGSNATNKTDMTIPGLPWSDWQIDAKDIQVARRDDGREWKLGGGAFGEVYKALLKGVNPVAVKVLRDQSYTSRDEFSKEVALLKALHNSHIVQFQGACVEEDKMLLITEFMDGGDLFKAIARKQVTWQLRGKSIAMDVLRGLHFLHSKRIVHMDLKSPNILLTRHGVAKLADVGLAKVIRDRNYITQVSVIGTFAWAAPEVLTNERCTEKADIFSFGIVLWEIVTGEPPVRGGRREVSVPEECSQQVADVITACLQTDPDKRPTASEVLDLLNSMVDSEQEPDVLSL